MGVALAKHSEIDGLEFRRWRWLGGSGWRKIWSGFRRLGGKSRLSQRAWEAYFGGGFWGTCTMVAEGRGYLYLAGNYAPLPGHSIVLLVQAMIGGASGIGRDSQSSSR